MCEDEGTRGGVGTAEATVGREQVVLPVVLVGGGGAVDDKVGEDDEREICEGELTSAWEEAERR